MALCIVLNKKDEDFYGFEFVFKALTKSKIEKRDHMLNIFIDDGRAVATDGRRLHTFDYHGKYSQGFYRVEAKTRTKIILVKSSNRTTANRNYPEYKDLMLKKGATVLADKLYEHAFYRNIYSNMIGDRTLNVDFLRDLPAENYEVTFTKEINEGEHTASVIFKFDRITAILMSMYL